jgi:hypothetical protein
MAAGEAIEAAPTSCGGAYPSRCRPSGERDELAANAAGAGAGMRRANAASLAALSARYLASCWRISVAVGSQSHPRA